MTSASSSTPEILQPVKKGGIIAFSAVLLMLKNFGSFFLKGGWLVKTGLTTILSYAVYGFVYGWQYAAAFIALLIIHEFGHWIWLRCNHVHADVPIFIPFVGAVIELKKLPPDSTTTAWTGLAGPLIGSAGAIIFWLAGRHLHIGALMAAGSLGFMLNLFQLIPASPLDGSWILASISKWLLVPGTLLIVLLAVVTKSPLLVIVAIVFTVSLFKRTPPPPTIPQPVQQRLTIKQLEQELNATPAALSTPSINNSESDILARRKRNYPLLTQSGAPFWWRIWC